MDPTNPPTSQTPTGQTPGAFSTAPSEVPPGSGVPPVWSMPPAPLAMPPVVAVSPGVPAARRRDPLTILMFAAAFVALGGVGFAAGRVTAPAAATASTGGRGGNGGFNFPGGGSFNPGGGNGAGGLGRFGGGVSIQGTITETTADHITIKLANGSSVTIPVDSSTAYHRQASATSSDVQTGATVLVQLTGGGANGRGGQAPNGSGAPGASGAPGTTTGRVVGTASDVTIVSP
jgi:hypothetical protein